MAKAPLLLIAAGGTGGHMFPAQALAEAMLARGWRVTLSTDARGARYAGGFPPGVRVEVRRSASFAQGGGLGARLLVPLKIAAGAMAATLRLGFARPALVIGFGGYPSLPALIAAWIWRRPRMIHEQNAVLGQVNRAFAPRVGAVACGQWPTPLPKGAKGVFTGNPVRRAIQEKAGAGYIPPGDYPMSLLVLGGSQGARILSDVVPEAVAALPEALHRHLRIAHQAREEDVARVAEAYAAAGFRAEVAPFFTDVPRRLSEAQLVVARAGASTLAELTVIGRPAILVPYAAALGDHQSANAATLAEAKAALVIAESDFTVKTLEKALRGLLTAPAKASKMAAAALAMGQPQAAEALVAEVLRLSGKNT